MFSIKVLVVEDNPIDMAPITEALKSINADYVAVSNAEDALMAIKASHFDIALLDINMPIMSGRELSTKIKSNPKTAHIKVMFLTASHNVKDVLYAVEMHAPYFIKGVPVATLLDTIKCVQLANSMIPEVENSTAFHIALAKKYQPEALH